MNKTPVLIFAFLSVLITSCSYFGFRESKYENAEGCDIFAKEDVVGTFVMYDVSKDRILLCNKERATIQYIPASTFKIVNSLNALENNIVKDENETFVWDGVMRDIPTWNQDTNLTMGMKNSTVWFYQEIARRTGEEKMQNFVSNLSYGNVNTDSGIDSFWLSGGSLKISTLEQVEFLRRLYEKKLPISEKNQEKVANLMILNYDKTWAFYGKTGLGSYYNDMGNKENLGWLVGWSINDGKAYIYALNIDIKNKPLSLRFDMVKELLYMNKALPIIF